MGIEPNRHRSNHSECKPSVPTDFASLTAWVAFSNITLGPNAFLQGGSTTGALGNLETFGANFITNCTECSNSANIVWFSDPTTTVQTITTDTIFGVPLGSFLAVSDVQVSLDLELPDGFSVAAVPEPSTWAMLLIGFAAIGFAGYRKSRRESFISDTLPQQNYFGWRHLD